jgi:hypothetical protein
MTRAYNTATTQQNSGGAVPPFAAGKNKIINGDMAIAQRSTSVAGITADTTYYTVDRFITRLITQGTFTQSQESDGPAGFSKSLKMLCTTADASPTGGDRIGITQRIEAANLQSLAYGTASAKRVTVSFWVKSNLTGTYILEMFNLGAAKQCSNPYTISTANTWERKTIVIAGDTATAISGDFTDLIFWLGAGTDYTTGTLQNTWAANSNPNRAVGQVNLAGTVNNYWQVTGIQMEIGSVATDFQTATGTLQGELSACYRYFQKFGGTQVNESFPYVGFSYSTTQGEGPLTHKGTMRTTPSLAFSTLKISDVATYNLAVTNLALTSSGSGLDSSYLVFTVASGTSSGKINYMRTDASTAGYIYLSAEL